MGEYLSPEAQAFLDKGNATPSGCGDRGCARCYGGSDGDEDRPTPVQPNRFDPYKALDRIECVVKHEGNWYSSNVKADLHALRAYITGMEK